MMRRTLIAPSCLAGLPAMAQTVPPHPPMKLPTPPEVIAPKAAPSTPDTSEVIKPPAGIDPEIAKPPPADTEHTMPVIRPDDVQKPNTPPGPGPGNDHGSGSGRP
jgi:hypothetical protein